MDVAKLPYFSLLRQRLETSSERQRLIAENLANASTPGFTPRDLDMERIERQMAAQVPAPGQLPLTRTHHAHLTAGGAPGPVSLEARERPDSETTIDGNSVVLEEQLIKANENRAAYELGLSLYRKGLELMRIAARPPR